MRGRDEDTTAAPSPHDREVDLHAVGVALWERKWRVILPALLVGVFTLIALTFVQPRYKSEARLLIEGRENIFLRPDADKLNADARQQIDLEALTSQAQILQSRDVAKEVIRKLKLDEKPEFNPTVGGFSLSRLFGIGKSPMVSADERVLRAYYDRLSVSPIDRSRVILIEFQSTDPDLAANIVNAVIDAYFDVQKANRQQQARGASEWLSTEIDNLRAKVIEAEGNVEKFRAKAGLFTGSNNANPASQQLTDLTAQLSAARSQKADLDARARVIRDLLNSGKPVEASDIINSELVRRLVEQRVTIRSQLAEQSSTLLELHPRIKELRAQLAALDAQIRGEVEALVHSVENDSRIAVKRIDALNGTIDQLKKQLGGEGEQDVHLRALEREAKVQRDLLESYLAKYRESMARDSLDATPSDVRVISRASASNVPLFPKKVPIVLITMLTAAFVAIAFIIASLLLDPNGHVPVDPERRRRFPGGSLPFFGQRGGGNRASSGTASATLQPRELLVTAQELTADLRTPGVERRRVTLIGSAGEAETGDTTISIARRLAQLGRGDLRVAAVDLAFDAPSLAAFSTDPGAPGIADVVRGEASFGDMLSRDRLSRVQLVGAGDIGADPRSITASPRLLMTLEALSHSYDHLIVNIGKFKPQDLMLFPKMAPRAVIITGEAEETEAQRIHEALTVVGFTQIVFMRGLAEAEGRERSAAA